MAAWPRLALALLLLLVLTAAHAVRRPLFGGLAPPNATACANTNLLCDEWADDGECALNPEYMHTNCKRACGGCADTPSPLKRPTRRKLHNGCADADDDCVELAAAGACLNGSDAPIRCPVSCGTCRFQKIVKEAFGCEDVEEHCAVWADAGECERNRAYMHSSCPVSCNKCDEKRVACSRPPNTPPAVKAGGIEATMRRMLRDFPQYKPVALSRPGEGKLGAKAPWVITLENFVSDSEADAFISTCKRHFDRSLAGDQLSPVRTSQQCWCSDNECERSALTKAVEARIVNLTNVRAPRYFEPFQILKYEAGQFYKVHHDQNSGTFTPQGVRVYTFFMYLSTPKGGGTRFADLDVVVPAVKGNAVIWPSVMDSNPDVDEPKTHHEGLPPNEGLKYAANVWVHNFDYRTPASRNCVLAHKNTH